MAANLQSILGDEVILPHDFLPDDTTIIYNKRGNPVQEKDYDDPDDEILADSRAIERYKALALAKYNDNHNTDYKFVKITYLVRTYENSILIHFGFTASPSRAESSSAAAKKFCAKLEAPLWSEGKEIVTSCCIVDGPKICEVCYSYMNENSGWDKDTESESESESEEVVPPVSQYSHLLADGVTLSDKAKLRLPLVLLALAYYNKKRHSDYKLVEVLPNCFSLESGYGMLHHCNFIARRDKSDASNKLFFAELKKPADQWVVTACGVIRGKVTAGCHACEGRWGKRVIHPAHGFRFGLYPRRYGSSRGRR